MSTCTIYNNISGALDQVITNLTMNALHHGFSENNGGTISIEVSEQADDSLRHEFSDNGCGIPIENRGKIFDPFFTARRNEGGAVNLSDEQQSQTIFEIMLPMDIDQFRN